ncbi:hypothetical protein NQD34_012263 [Periophthalmus magnuspinnatus]|nr:hypothetical protein NQD34_012263 [Periophthalmus magnuspinnatus]
MWRTFLSALCVLYFPPIRCVFHGSCPRKEPPPGVVIVSPGSELSLTCSGRVIVDGVKVVSPSFPASVTHSTVNSITLNTELPKPQEVMNRERKIIPTLSPSDVSQPIRAKTEWSAGEVDDFEDESDDEEKEESSVKLGVQWKWNNKHLQGKTQESTLSLSHLRVSDSGRYSCHHRGTERFSTKIIVAEAAETPHLFCYKKSPSSKIRCEWTPQTQAPKGTSCSLFIRKSLSGLFFKVPCSYSTWRSKCWCAMDHNEEDKRTLYQAYLCVSSITNNSTSDLLSFTPMHILKPDPPYNVSVQPEKGLNRTLVVMWRPPYTWKLQDQFYALIYEVRYKPLMSVHFQTNTIYEQTRRHTITDAEAGERYEVQIRARDEYDGQWSEWGRPQYGRSWTGTTEEQNEDLLVTSIPYMYSEGSGSGDYFNDVANSMDPQQTVPHHYLWIIVFLGFCVTIFAMFIIRYKDQCVSKLQSLRALSQCSDSVHPRPGPAPAVANRHALLNKNQPLDEVKERREQELRTEDRTEAINLNNTSYFLVQMED